MNQIFARSTHAPAMPKCDKGKDSIGKRKEREGTETSGIAVSAASSMKIPPSFIQHRTRGSTHFGGRHSKQAETGAFAVHWPTLWDYHLCVTKIQEHSWGQIKRCRCFELRKTVSQPINAESSILSAIHNRRPNNGPDVGCFGSRCR